MRNDHNYKIFIKNLKTGFKNDSKMFQNVPIKIYIKEILREIFYYHFKVVNGR